MMRRDEPCSVGWSGWCSARSFAAITAPLPRRLPTALGSSRVWLVDITCFRDGGRTGSSSAVRALARPCKGHVRIALFRSGEPCLPTAIATDRTDPPVRSRSIICPGAYRGRVTPPEPVFTPESTTFRFGVREHVLRRPISLLGPYGSIESFVLHRYSESDLSDDRSAIGHRRGRHGLWRPRGGCQADLQFGGHTNSVH